MKYEQNGHIRFRKRENFRLHSSVNYFYLEEERNKIHSAVFRTQLQFFLLVCSSSRNIMAPWQLCENGSTSLMTYITNSIKLKIELKDYSNQGLVLNSPILRQKTITYSQKFLFIRFKRLSDRQPNVSKHSKQTDIQLQYMFYLPYGVW